MPYYISQRSAVANSKSMPLMEALEPRQLLSADLVGAVDVSAIPNPFVPGDSLTLRVLVTNQGDQPAVGRMDIHFHISPTPFIADSLSSVVLSNQSVSLVPGKSKLFATKISMPSAIPAGDYYLLADIDPTDAIPENGVANNLAASTTRGTLAYQFGSVPGRTKPVRLILQDADGSKATFSLKGNGTGQLTPSGEAFALSLSGTDAYSSLSISVKGGDGRFSLGDITVGSLKSISAAAVDLAGDLRSTGTISSITVGDIASGHSLIIAGSNVPLTLKALTVANLQLESGSAIKSLKVADWTRSGNEASAIIAPALASLQSSGSLQADLHLTAPGLTLGKMSATGLLGPGLWDVPGSAGRISAGRVDPAWKANFGGALSGLAVNGDAGGILAAGSIGSITVKGNLTNAQVFAGADLGSDAAVGGADSAADIYQAGWIGKLSIAGSVSNSIIMAGVHPFDGAFNDINDAPIGGASSYIKSLSIGGALTDIGINAGRLPASAKITGLTVNPAQDARFGQAPFALTSAGMTDANGEVTLDIAGQPQEFRFRDEATLKPLAGAGVAVSVDADSLSFGIMTIIAPGSKVPVQIVVLEGSAAPAGATMLRASSIQAEPMPVAAEDDAVTVLLSDVGTKATLDIATPLLVKQVFHNIPEAAQDAVSAEVGALASGVTSLINIGIHCLDAVSDGAVSNYLASLPVATSVVMTAEEAKAHVIEARVDDLKGTALLVTMARKLDPLAIPGLAMDLASDYVHWDVANMGRNGGANMGVRVTTIAGMEVYSLVPISMSQRIEDAGLVHAAVPEAAGSTGSLEMIRKGDLGDGYSFALDSAGNADVAVPLGDYFSVVHVPGFQAKQMPVTVTAGGVQLNVDLDLPPEPGFTVSPASTLQTSESGQADSFTLALNTKPTANVTIKLSSSDTTEGKLSKSSVVFTPANWSEPQMIVVTGVDDSLSDGNINYSIRCAPAVSTDSTYSGMTLPSVDATNLDNEISPSIDIASWGATRLSGGSTSGEFAFTISGTVTGPVGTWLCVSPPSGLAISGWQFASDWTAGGSNDQGYTGSYAAIRRSGEPASATFTCTFRSYVDSEDYPMGRVPGIDVLLGALPPDGHAILDSTDWIQVWPWR